MAETPEALEGSEASGGAPERTPEPELVATGKAGWRVVVLPLLAVSMALGLENLSAGR